MRVMTYEGVVEKGQIKLIGNVHLPEKVKVFVVVPDVMTQKARIYSPRLKHPEQAADFVMEVVEENPDAQV